MGNRPKKRRLEKERVGEKDTNDTFHATVSPFNHCCYYCYVVRTPMPGTDGQARVKKLTDN